MLLYISCTVPVVAQKSIERDGSNIKLENQHYILLIDVEYGSLVSFVEKNSREELIGNKGPQYSFNMEICQDEKSCIEFIGTDYKPTNFAIDLENNRLLIGWKNFSDPDGKLHQITFNAEIKITEDLLTFDGKVINRTAMNLKSIRWPATPEVIHFKNSTSDPNVELYKAGSEPG